MNTLPDPAESAPPKQSPESFALRGRPRPVVRFRRGMILGIVGAVAASLVTLSWFALQPPTFRKSVTITSSEEPTNTAPPDALAAAPKNYGEVPRLGPPLPGDLGRPMLEHERSLGAGASESPADASPRRGGVASKSERLAAAEAAARSSAVLVQLGQGEEHRRTADISNPQAPGASMDVAPSSVAASAGQLQMIAFTRGGEGDVNPDRLHPLRSPFMLAAGTIIPASLITGINSDLPGMVIAQVTENVRDTATGTIILVPQGARLIGRYDSLVAFGQRRALLVWNRIIFPDGSSLELDSIPGADVSGFAGLRDGVDSHTWQLLKGIALSTLLGVGTQLSLERSESDLLRAIRESAQQSASNAGAQITSHELSIQPTITIRPGWPVRALLNKDLVLQPWRG